MVPVCSQFPPVGTWYVVPNVGWYMVLVANVGWYMVPGPQYWMVHGTWSLMLDRTWYLVANDGWYMVPGP